MPVRLLLVTSLAAIQVAPVFRVDADDLWLNLHHFLYVLGRAESRTTDAARRAVAGAPADQAAGLKGLPVEQQQMWRDAVTAYAGGLSKLDAVFDAPLIRTANALVRAGASASIDAAVAKDLEPAVLAVLERAAPTYQKAWWPAHRAANQEWKGGIEKLLAAHGARVVTYIAGIYGQPWPADGFPMHVLAYTNWAGAFSTRGRLLVISSLDPGNRGAVGLEIVFHEAMHQWDNPTLAMLEREGRAQGKTVPDLLTHALIWVTAGEAVRRVIPGHVGYAEANGLWRGDLGALKPALDAAWVPYLHGKTTRAAAVTELIKRVGR